MRHSPEHTQNSQLARLIDQTRHVGVATSVWERLNLEELSRRLIEVARIAAAEHAMVRVRDAIRKRDERSCQSPVAGSQKQLTAGNWQLATGH